MVLLLRSNWGGGEMRGLRTGGLGLVQRGEKPAASLDGKVERTAVEAARRKFSPEFMNRLDKVVVFHPLKAEQLEEILEIELGMVQRRGVEDGQGANFVLGAAGGREALCV